MHKIAGFAAACLFCASAVPASADVQVSLQNGRVTIRAKDATVREILTEWARVGHTKIVNVERIPGSSLTFELTDMPEQQALGVLLRSISGYMTAPRTTMDAPNTSVFDRIIVMPTLAAAAPPSSGVSSPPPPMVTFATPQPAPVPEENDDQRPALAVAQPAASGTRGPVFFTFPQPQTPQVQPQGGAASSAPAQAPAAAPPGGAAYPGGSTISAPPGVSVPGMVVPAPAPQPGAPAQTPAQQP